MRRRTWLILILLVMTGTILLRGWMAFEKGEPLGTALASGVGFGLAYGLFAGTILASLRQLLIYIQCRRRGWQGRQIDSP